MNPMSTAPRDRPFLAKMIPLGGDNGHTAFCRLRPLTFSATADQLNDPEFPRWDVNAPVFFNDSHFVGWTDLPEGFDNPRFRNSNI